METRAKIAIGGTTAFAVTAAVVATVAVTNAAVLADTPGAPVRSNAVELDSVPQVRLTPPPVAESAEVEIDQVATEPVADPPPVTETVPAPAPVLVAPGPAQPVPAVPAEPVVQPMRDDDGRDDARHPTRGDREEIRRDRDEAPRRDKAQRPEISAPAEKKSVPGIPLRGDGSKRDRSHGSPDSRD